MKLSKILNPSYIKFFVVYISAASMFLGISLAFYMNDMYHDRQIICYAVAALFYILAANSYYNIVEALNKFSYFSALTANKLVQSLHKLADAGISYEDIINEEFKIDIKGRL